MVALVACGGGTPAQPAATAPTTEPADASATSSTTSEEHNESGSDSTSSDTGTLQFRANGEDFIRQGFVTKDGWTIAFEHVYVTLADITAYQADPPFDAETDEEIQAQTQVSLDAPVTVDLAEGDENADPVRIGEVEAPAGRYNALAWRLVRATDGPASGAVIMMQGSAVKDGQTIDFTIALDQESAYTCGDYVGDERKGILEAGGVADVEATFHFDHIFGDAEMPADDSLNTGALGFEPLAQLATDGILTSDMALLQEQLPAEEYDKLVHSHLAHVGEGHCR